MKFSLMQEELFARINWLIKLRGIAALGVFLAILFVNKVLKLALPTTPLYVITVILLIYNILFFFYAKKILTEKKAQRLSRGANHFFNVQISCDFIALVVLIHFSGGVENPFIFYSIFHIIIAAIVLTRRASYLQANLAVFLFGSLVWLEYYGLIPHFCLEGFIQSDLSQNKIYVLGIFFTFATTLYICVWMATSITQRLRQKQTEIESAHMQLNRITEGIEEGILLIDRDFKILWANKSQRELFGEIVGDNCYRATHHGHSPCHGPNDICPIDEVLKNGKSSTVVHTHFDKEGRGKFIEVSAYPLQDEKGQIIEFVHISKDVTERMQKEEELQKAYRDLKEMQDVLVQSEKMNAIGQLASGVAHEVKNPLAIIKQGIDYLEGKLPSLQEHVSEAFQMIKSNIDRANNIINALVDFSRATSLQKTLEDINSILESSLILIQYRVRLEGIEVVKELGKDLPKILADKNKLEQVFINILLNAIEAMPQGGKLFIRSYLKQLNQPKNGVGRRGEDHFKVGEEAVVVEIEDTGVGISENNLKRTFDPFFTTKEPGKGTGLGLSVTKNIVLLHKGLIEIKSQVGKGTKVAVTLKTSDTVNSS
ncbi:MAG: ATP-binding protein [Candidatus Omnitrophota bacterium]|nr:ATP-binding protein [Candidatus Omnitrophota bacterium]